MLENPNFDTEDISNNNNNDIDDNGDDNGDDSHNT